MLYLAFIFLLAAIGADLLALTVAASSAARLLVLIFSALFTVTFASHLVRSTN